MIFRDRIKKLVEKVKLQQIHLRQLKEALYVSPSVTDRISSVMEKFEEKQTKHSEFLTMLTKETHAKLDAISKKAVAREVDSN